MAKGAEIEEHIRHKVLDREELEAQLEVCRKEIEALRKAKNELFHKEKLISIGQLSAGIAHEINNPLAFVSGNFSALLRYVDDMKSYISLLENGLFKSGINSLDDMENCRRELNQYKADSSMEFIYSDIEDIRSESAEGFSRIQTIISSLSEFSRFEPQSTVQSMNVNDSLDSTLNVVWNKIKYVADVERDYDGNLPEIECIKNEISQVLLNIIINASQAIADLKNEGKGLITLITRNLGDTIQIVISDTGPGISKNLITQIFDPFFTTKETGKGTGLGLSISYDIVVNRHNGRIWVESQVGEGTSFFIELPVTYHEENRKV